MGKKRHEHKRAEKLKKATEELFDFIFDLAKKYELSGVEVLGMLEFMKYYINWKAGDRAEQIVRDEIRKAIITKLGGKGEAG